MPISPDTMPETGLLKTAFSAIIQNVPPFKRPLPVIDLCPGRWRGHGREALKASLRVPPGDNKSPGPNNWEKSEPKTPACLWSASVSD